MNTTTLYRGKRNYELSNLLGNFKGCWFCEARPYSLESREQSDSGVSVVISDKRKSFCDEELGVERFEAEVLSAVDYYLFGMMMPDRQWYVGGNSYIYRFGYGGHEVINESNGIGNVVDMGDRWLDVRLGRTSKTDRRAKEFSELSPYSYAGNNPLLFIDINGEKIFIYYKDENDNIISFEYGSQLSPPDNPFVTETIAALNKIAESPRNAKKFNFLVNTDDFNINIQQGDITEAHLDVLEFTNSKGEDNVLISRDQTVLFNPTQGLKQLSTGIINAPFVSLWHELGHLYNAIHDVQNGSLDEFLSRKNNNYIGGSNEHWTNEEEMYNIIENEWPLIEDMGGFKRESHVEDINNGVKRVETKGSTSDEEKK